MPAKKPIPPKPNPDSKLLSNSLFSQNKTDMGKRAAGLKNRSEKTKTKYAALPKAKRRKPSGSSGKTGSK